MKQNIEIPEGYEFDHVTSPILGNGGGVLSVILKKKQTKDFNWYIDEYLREDPFTTKDEISNHLFTEDIKEIKTKLRSGDYRWVPWEIKIGLFRFVCESNRSNWIVELKEYQNANMATHLYDIIPRIFIDDLFKTKTN